MVKPGGRLVYATCSLLAQENEQVAQAFTAAHVDFRPVSVADLLVQLKIGDPEHAASLCAGPNDGRDHLRLWPHRHATDGFFAAVWQRQK